ncbi:unnamed protein product, partial [Ectocarpus sp. 8 AP-2014]
QSLPSNADSFEVAQPKRSRSVRIAEMSEEDALTRAITCLEDALGYRDPHYYSDPASIRSYRLRQSRAWQSGTSLAVLAYIAACFLGKPPFSADWGGMPPLSALQGEMGQTWGLFLECGCVVFFAFDMYLLYNAFMNLFALSTTVNDPDVWMPLYDRAFEALDQEGTGHVTREKIMKLLKTIRPHYGESKRYMMYERIVQSASLRGRPAQRRGRAEKEYEAAEVTQVYRRDFCNNVVEALSLKIRTMREQNIARCG